MGDNGAKGGEEERREGVEKIRHAKKQKPGPEQLGGRRWRSSEPCRSARLRAVGALWGKLGEGRSHAVPLPPPAAHSGAWSPR